MPRRAPQVGQVAELSSSVFKLKEAIHQMEGCEDVLEKARLARTLRLETMVDVRAVCDAAEAVVPADKWTLAPYTDLLFLDMTHAEDPSYGM